MTVTPLSVALRERTRDAHSSSEGAGFMSSLLKGERSRDDYIALVAQHYFLYEALEAAADRMRPDPIAARFISDDLTRLPALVADLVHLLGPDWRERIHPLPTTAEYVDRIAAVGATTVGFVAHHYTRYLGDLSGGQFIGRVVQRQFGFGVEGIAFYVFEGIPDVGAFKDGYRAELDAAPWNAAEHEQVIAEVLRAYDLNTRLFEDLARATDVVVA